MKMTKFTLFSMLMVAFMATSNAQIKTPPASPGAKIEQVVGLSTISVEYSRPGVKGREIFGGLVPFGEVWRTGANQATKITFSEDVKLEGQEVKKGSYAILTKPTASEWTFMLYPHTSTNWGSYLDSKDTPITFAAPVIGMNEVVENFMIAIDEIKADGAGLYFMWDKTMVPVEIKLDTDKAVEASIESTMAGPSANDYSAAANYYLAEGKDMKKALEWINKSISMDTQEKYWILRSKSLIQAKLGDKQGAIETAKKSLELATKADNKDYIKMNMDSMKEWSMD